MTVADENEITLTVPNNIYQLWIESNYMALLQSSVASVLGGPREIHFLTAPKPNAPAPHAPGGPLDSDEAEEEVDDAASPSRLARTPVAVAEPPKARGHRIGSSSGAPPRRHKRTLCRTRYLESRAAPRRIRSHRDKRWDNRISRGPRR